jgi:pilus assembly protein TadC
MTLALFHYSGGGGFLFLGLFGLVYFIFWLYCLIDVIRSDFKDPNMKLIWIVILLFAHVFGPIIYLVMRNRSKTT